MTGPLPFVWPIGVPFWVAYSWSVAAELPLFRQSQQRATRPGPEDAGSMRLALWCGGLAIVAAFAVAVMVPATAMTSAPAPAYVGGIAFVLAGGLLRRHCFKMLGARFTYAVRVSTDQAVVERGAYRLVRHPSYTAGMLIFTGVGLALGNWASLAVAFALPALAYSYRIAVEERALLATLGPAYADYMTRTRRLIPFVL